MVTDLETYWINASKDQRFWLMRDCGINVLVSKTVQHRSYERIPLAVLTTLQLSWSRGLVNV
jgi:hypothetical protein